MPTKVWALSTDLPEDCAVVFRTLEVPSRPRPWRYAATAPVPLNLLPDDLKVIGGVLKNALSDYFGLNGEVSGLVKHPYGVEGDTCCDNSFDYPFWFKQDEYTGSIDIRKDPLKVGIDLDLGEVLAKKTGLDQFRSAVNKFLQNPILDATPPPPFTALDIIDQDLLKKLRHIFSSNDNLAKALCDQLPYDMGGVTENIGLGQLGAQVGILASARGGTRNIRILNWDYACPEAKGSGVPLGHITFSVNVNVWQKYLLDVPYIGPANQKHSSRFGYIVQHQMTGVITVKYGYADGCPNAMTQNTTITGRLFTRHGSTQRLFGEEKKKVSSWVDYPFAPKVIVTPKTWRVPCDPGCGWKGPPLSFSESP